MADQQNALLRLLAAQAAQMGNLGGATATTSSANPLNGLANGLAAASANASSSRSSRPTPSITQQQAALAQQMAALSAMASMNPLMGMTGMGSFGTSPEMLMWQAMMAQAQIAQLQQAQQAAAQAAAQKQQQQSFDEVLKKLAENIKKSNANAANNNSVPKPSTSTAAANSVKPIASTVVSSSTPTKTAPVSTASTSASSGTTATATVAIKEGTSLNNLVMQNATPTKTTPSKQEKPKAVQPVLNKSMLDNAIWQLFATQMLQQSLAKAQQQQQQQQQAAQNGHSRSAKKENVIGIANDQLKAEFAAGTSKTGTPSPNASYDSSDRSKKALPTEAQLRVPLKYGWKRQTFIRSMTPSGIRGDVIYYTPCNKRISNYAEVVRYLMKSPNQALIGRDNFAFSGKMVVGEFLMPRENANGEKTIERLTEKEIYEELMKLNRGKIPMRNGDRGKMTPVRDGVSRATPDSTVVVEQDFYEETIEEAYEDEDKVKWSREPVDDLLLTETRPLPELSRIKNLELDGNAFANALMVHEFVHNFAHVLSIDLTKIPTLSDLCAGLAGDKKHFDSMMHLVKTLFALVLEYPGLPSGRKGKTKLGQSLQEIGMKQENYSEIMRMFLDSRDDQGKQLSKLLDTSSFESLSPENKTEILAYLCNELLCCRNIVKEIDGNLEDISKLKGERWMREGKARVLKQEQKRKRKLAKQNREDGDEKAEENGVGSDSEGSRPATPHKDKKFTPGLGQCEILTPEEENMSPEELEVQIGVLYKESAIFKRQIDDLNRRVRSFPFGWDRFHRQYWQLTHTGVIVVESVESGGAHNPACNTEETCNKDPASITSSSYVDPDVISCLEDTIDQVVLTRAHVDRKKRKRYRRMENAFKRGWWTIDNKEALESLKSSLHGRGIRERCLHRLLCKNWFLKDIKLGGLVFDKIDERITDGEAEATVRSRVMKLVNLLKKKIIDSKLQVSAASAESSINGDTVNVDQPDDWSYHQISDAPSIEDLKSAILSTEQLVERRYLRHNFYTNEPHPVAKILGLEKKEAESEKGEEDEDTIDADEKDDEENDDKEKDDTDGRELVEKWRSYVQEAATVAQLMLSIQCLESSIAWERSITQARCQICKSQERSEKMLFCTQCGMGYHTQCFRPALSSTPKEGWYCPRCKETATGKPTCVLCAKDGAPIYPCKNCSNFFHLDCTKEHIPESVSEYVCAGCDMKKFERKVIMRGESEEKETTQNGCHAPENAEPEKDLKRGVKRKAEPATPVVFPNEMINDLCRSMVDELETHNCSGPFMEPVDLELVVGYKEVIANPIDLSTIRNRIEANFYESPDDFAADMELMFNNCKTFNEDDSPVGVAGHTLHKFYQKRWRQLKYNYSKRLKRMRH